LLSVVDGALAVLRGEHPHLARVSVALRVVPGEFDLSWVGRIADAARLHPALHGQLDAAQVQVRLSSLDAALQQAQQTMHTLQGEAETPSLKDALAVSQHLLGRLRAGWYASGLWSSEAITVQDAAEVEAVEDELFFRLRCIERAALLRVSELPQGDAERLTRLCQALRVPN
jgi:hypothetical protein